MHEEVGIKTDPNTHKILEYMNLFDKKKHFHIFDIITFTEITDEEAKGIYNKAEDEHTELKWVTWDEFIELGGVTPHVLFPSMYFLIEKYKTLDEIWKSEKV